MAIRVDNRHGLSRHWSPWVLAVLLVAPACFADDIPEPLRRCAELNDDAQRLACYDRYVSRGGIDWASAEPALETAPPARKPDPAAHADPEARFGLPKPDDDEDVDEISARITEIVVRASRERIITLDNGQVWVEDGPKPSLRLKVGDTVTIRSGIFGSYRLVGPGNRSNAVDRVR